jgi:hypothetical protein
MSAFEFAFSFFGLILGFTLVEVLSGLVRTTRGPHPSARRLYLTCGLGLFVCLDLITFWSVLFAAREFVPVNALALDLGFLITGVYYWAASMIFPDASEAVDLDEHYFRVRRKVAGAVLFCNLAFFAAISAAMGRLPPVVGILEAATFDVLFVALILVRTKRLSAAVLTIILMSYLISAVLRSVN